MHIFYKKHSIVLFLFLFIATIAVCSCANQQETAGLEYPPEDNLYIICSNNKYGILNANGEFVIAPQPNKLELVRDEFTKAPKYIKANKTMMVPLETEHGTVIKEETDVAALYDVKGKLLYDYEPHRFYPAFGDFLYVDDTIVNMKTGKTFSPPPGSSIFFTDDKIILSRESPASIWVYHRNMKLVKELHGYYYNYAISDNGKSYYVVGNITPDTNAVRTNLCDENFNIIYNGNNSNSFKINNDFLIVQDNVFNYKVIDLTTGETILTRDKEQGVYYYDGNLMLTGEHIDGNLLGQYRLPDSQWQVIHLQDENKSEAYHWITIENQTPSHINMDDCKAIHFYCQEKNNHLTVLDSEGNIILQCKEENGNKIIQDKKENILLTLPVNCIIHIGGDKNIFTVDYPTGHNSNNTTWTQAYTGEGKSFQLPPKYTAVDSMDVIVKNQKKIYLQAFYYDKNDKYCFDILDEQGKPIIENLYITDLYAGPENSCDGYRMLVQQGNYQGLMDMEGNWLYKENIFNTSANEY